MHEPLESVVENAALGRPSGKTEASRKGANLSGVGGKS
jgi:hypothetical protein